MTVSVQAFELVFRRPAVPAPRPAAMLDRMGWARELLHRIWVQRAIRAALAAGLAWQVALVLPGVGSHAYYAPLGAVIAVHPTVADSAAAAWRTVLAIVLGFVLAVSVYELTRAVPNALTIALIVVLAVGIEQWRVLREQASWVSFAAVLMLTVGASDPAEYAAQYGGLTLLGAGIGVLVTTVLFPPMQLTTALRSITWARTLLAAQLESIADGLRRGELPGPDEWAGRGRDLDAALDRMRAAEHLVERARRANPRARRWRGRATSIRDQSRSLDRVAVLVDDLTMLVVEFQPHRHGLDRVDCGTGWVLADALCGLAGVIRLPFHVTDAEPDERDRAIGTAVGALDRLTRLLRTAEVADDEGFFALGAVTVGMHRSLRTLHADVRRFPQAA